jgi:hypothetical protein
LPGYPGVPARTNDFQRLVLLFERQLVPRDFTVTESKSVVDRTGKQREIDIAVEGTVAGRRVLFAVECRDHARKQDVHWIEELMGKYAHVFANEVFAVSRSGFSRSAVALARSQLTPPIKTLSLTDALDTNWQGYFTDLHYVTLDLVMPMDEFKLDIVLSTAPHASRPELGSSGAAGLRFVSPGQDSGPTAAEIAGAIQLNEVIQTTVRRAVRPGTAATLRFDVHFPDDTRAVGGNVSLPVKEIAFEQEFRRELREIALEHGSYAGAQVAHTVIDDYFGGKAYVTLFQNDPTQATVKMSVDQHARIGPARIEVHGVNIEVYQG